MTDRLEAFHNTVTLTLIRFYRVTYSLSSGESHSSLPGHKVPDLVQIGTTESTTTRKMTNLFSGVVVGSVFNRFLNHCSPESQTANLAGRAQLRFCPGTFQMGRCHLPGRRPAGKPCNSMRCHSSPHALVDPIPDWPENESLLE
jgi:hypothetical protein